MAHLKRPDVVTSSQVTRNSSALHCCGSVVLAVVQIQWGLMVELLKNYSGDCGRRINLTLILCLLEFNTITTYDNYIDA